MMNEKEKRRPEFRPGAEVLMADGQYWHLAKPRVRFTPDTSGPRGYSVKLYGPTPQFQSNLDHLNECLEFHETLDGMPEEEAEREWQAHPEFDATGAQLAIGSDMLLANYDLSPEEVAELLQFSNDPDGDPEAFELRLDVMAVARGRVPKPKAGGSEA